MAWARERNVLRGLSEAPPAALIIGVAVTLPFVAGALAMVFGPPAVVINTYLRLADYAAIGLAFLGAVHWGLAMAAGAQGKPIGWARYPLAVLPAACAFLALALIGPVPKFLLLLLGYFGVFMLDVRAVGDGLAPSWYGRLRKPLSVVVLVSLGVVLLVVARASLGSDQAA